MGLLPDRMKTLKVVVPYDYTRNLLRFLSICDDIEIIDVQKKPFDLASFEYGTKIKDLSDKFDKVVEHLEIEEKFIKSKMKVQIDDANLGTILKDIERVSESVILKLSQIDERVTLAEQELKKNKSVIEIAKNLIPFGFSFEDLDDERPYFNITIGRLETKKLPRFKWNLDAITDGNYLLKESDTEGNQSFIAIGTLGRYQEDLSRLLVAYGFEKFSIPERISGNPEKVVNKNKEKIIGLEKRIAELKAEADVLINEHGSTILAYTEQLKMEENYLRISNMIRVTKRNTTFWGWVPKKRIKHVNDSIMNMTEKTAFIEFTEPVFEESEYPTRTSVPKFARIYDGLVNAYGTPGYNEFNSALLLQIFFPIMFGIMFAHVGHGLLFMLAGFWGMSMRNKQLGGTGFMDEIKGYFKSGYMLIIVSGFFAMIFGVLFGSYFGGTHEAAGFIPEPIWFGPEGHDFHNGASPVILMLELSLLIGMIHMTIGYVLRFITNIKHKHYAESILVTLMWAIFHWSLFILVFTFGTNFMEWFAWDNSGTFDMALLSINGEAIQFFTINHAMLFFLIGLAVPILIMSAYLLIHGKMDGLAELIELLLSTLSNTVSYARIFAMNAVHGALSHIFTLKDFTSGDGLGVINYIGMGIGSLVILAIEGLFSFIQTLRLQWVEFFAKVGYQGNGRKFKTMALARKYSTISRK
ncbi:MAG: V-type ATP synthase subunit I [Candidatus Heimdallarchaeota archaeon]